MTTNHRHYL